MKPVSLGRVAISTTLPLPAMGALALVGSGLLMRPGAKAAVSPALSSPGACP